MLTRVSGCQFDYYRRELLQTYGFEYLFTLNNLEQLGLLKKEGGARLIVVATWRSSAERSGEQVAARRGQRCGAV